MSLQLEVNGENLGIKKTSSSLLLEQVLGIGKIDPTLKLPDNWNGIETEFVFHMEVTVLFINRNTFHRRVGPIGILKNLQNLSSHHFEITN